MNVCLPGEPYPGPTSSDAPPLVVSSPAPESSSGTFTNTDSVIMKSINTNKHLYFGCFLF